MTGTDDFSKVGVVLGLRLRDYACRRFEAILAQCGGFSGVLRCGVLRV